MLEETLLTTLQSASKALTNAVQSGLCDSFALIGGLAVSARGYPRATQDIDFLVNVSDQHTETLAEFLDAEYRAPDLGDPRSGVFSFSALHARTGVPVQGIRVGPKLSAAAMRDIEDLQIEHIPIPVLGLHGLILLKLYAGSEQDILDVKSLLSVNLLDDAELHSVTQLLKPFGLHQTFSALAPSKAP